MRLLLASMIDRFSRLFGRTPPGPAKRVLVNEILSIQILSTAAIGALAVASLYWGGQWVLQDNYGRWALQWTEELNDLGAPLYLSDDQDAISRIERYIDKYPEIGRVTYYRQDGVVLFAINKDGDDTVTDDLSQSRLRETRALVGAAAPYLVDSGIIDPRKFEILAPVWTESIRGDGLFAFNPSESPLQSQLDLVGFVGLHLDFITFHDRLLSNIKTAVMVLLVLLVVSTMYGRRVLRRALTSISDLHQPLKELAAGNLSVEFKAAEHREISEIVEALQSTASALSERDERLLNLANHDVLTGLYNRRRFVEELKTELEHVISDGHHSALLFIDLDQFKYINDTCGHPAGDRLISKVANEIKRSVGNEGLVARFGGDEFAVLLNDTNKPATKKIAEKILEDMRRLSHVEQEQVFHIHCSIGATMIIGNELNHDELVAQADIACREAKSAGRNRMQFYNLSEREAQRLTTDVGWMNKLRQALDGDLFELRFQPINDIATGLTTHHEILLRLKGEGGKLISPDAFLPAAVRFGLMSEIDNWMIRRAARAHAEHRDGNSELNISVNLSANAFEHDDLAGYVASCLEEYEVPPGNVIFEITESLAARHLDHVEQQISSLRAMGCRLALDDFGTGYSSFSFLQRLQADYIKIDGSFVVNLVDNPVDQKMIRLIAEIGREAGMKTIAEYVQSAEVLEMLGDLGVDLVQGYYIGRPAKRPIPKTMPIPLNSRRNRDRDQKSYSA